MKSFRYFHINRDRHRGWESGERHTQRARVIEQYWDAKICANGSFYCDGFWLMVDRVKIRNCDGEMRGSDKKRG